MRCSFVGIALVIGIGKGLSISNWAGSVVHLTVIAFNLLDAVRNVCMCVTVRAVREGGKLLINSVS